jgi:alcohol dehydrogenase (cytochrome c)
VYVATVEWCNKFYSSPPPYREGLQYFGSAFQDIPKERGWGALRAIDPRTAEVAWEFKLHAPPFASTLATAGGLVFAGSDEGH